MTGVSTVMNEQSGQPETKSQKKPKQLVMRLLPLAVVGAGIAAFFIFDLDRFLSFEALKDNRDFLKTWTAENTALAAIIFMLVYCIMVALTSRRSLGDLAGGFIFGTWVGGLYVVIGATLGATAIFLIARYALRPIFSEKSRQGDFPNGRWI